MKKEDTIKFAARATIDDRLLASAGHKEFIQSLTILSEIMRQAGINMKIWTDPNTCQRILDIDFHIPKAEIGKIRPEAVRDERRRNRVSKRASRARNHGFRDGVESVIREVYSMLSAAGIEDNLPSKFPSRESLRLRPSPEVARNIGEPEQPPINLFLPPNWGDTDDMLTRPYTPRGVAGQIRPMQTQDAFTGTAQISIGDWQRAATQTQGLGAGLYGINVADMLREQQAMRPRAGANAFNQIVNDAYWTGQRVVYATPTRQQEGAMDELRYQMMNQRIDSITMQASPTVPYSPGEEPPW